MRPIALLAVLAALPVALLAASVLPGCNSSKPPYLCSGECVPTVEGAPSTGYANYEEGRAAFSRSDKEGSFIAVLEDVAWLRFEGEESAILEKHRAYFEQGYTTFEVTLLTKDFTQPTNETFVLTDSKGARLVGKPVGYQGSMGQENERFAARFQVSFRHAVTREIGWVKLVRVADGAELEWRFPWAVPLEGAASTAVTVPTERPTNLMRPRNPAPEPVAQGNGRPVNLLGEVPASAEVGEPAWSEPPGAAGFPPPAVAPAPPVQMPPAPGNGVRPGYLPEPTVRGRP